MSDLSENTAPTTVQLTVSGVLADLGNGLTRAMIQAKYKLSGKDMKALFSHEKLKGRKTTPAPGFVLIDDTEEVGTAELTDPQPIMEEVMEIPELIAQDPEISDEF